MLNNTKRTGTSVQGCSSKLSDTPIDMMVKWLEPSNWWEKPKYVNAFLLLLSIADIANLYIILSDSLAQRQLFLFIITLAMCLAINLMPFFYVQLIKKRQYGEQVSGAIFVMLPLIFAIMIAFLFWLRFATRYDEFGMNSFTQSIGGSATAFQTNSPAATPLAAIVSFFPVVTAMISALIGFMSEDPMVKRLRELNIKRILLKETENQLNAVIAEYMINKEGTRLFDEDAEKYSSAISKIDAIGQKYKDQFRIDLAGVLADSVAISHLTSKGE
jgi:hypothetical protein